ncbi:MAG: tripartite tricarboxylate transporter substrate binding protein [Comamonas sp.]|jgi:tripartite-type tricarboxylate transporter receptor subunit TctC|uniref:Bug family tripartite tricarboxylate transporter substrate binding protein n=1 Tax=Comamonas sp. TaxID=34028 RepID=UPI002837933A|nr:tripartite tricarboxylate transporter substrate binding protein [Comamonas sp.]MDR0217041.1 tripartite tricarboxylate transporter substrate binding protein [Comamonas sp.]
MNRRNSLLSVMAAVAALASPLSQAQEPIRLIVPYAPGGPLDITSRALAERVRDSLGVVIIDNKAGAGGNIGADAIAKANPDGMTIGLAATATHAVNPWLYTKMPYDAGKDFAGITQMVRVPNVLVMNAAKAEQLKIHSVADLVTYAKSHPGKLNYGSGGNGSAGHLAGEMLKQKAGIFALHVPYRGANPAQLALLSGEVDFNIDNLAAAAPNIKSGKLVALAVTSLNATPLLPNVPPLSKTYPGFAIDTWWGLVAPAGTSKPVLDKLSKAFNEALQAPETKTRFNALMAEPVGSTPAEFDKFMAAERAKYQPIVKASGAKVD